MKPASFCIIMMLGYMLKRIRFFKENDDQVIAKIVLNITLPMTVINAFSSLAQDAKYYWIVLFGFICSFLPLVIMYFVSGKLTAKQRVFQMINIAGYNIGCFSLPVIQGFFGASGAGIACLFDIGNAIMMTGGSYAITSTLLHISGHKESFRDILMKFLKSIPFDTYMLMLLMMIFHVSIPDFLLEISAPFANANAFLAMLMLGMMLKIETDKHVVLSVMKLIILRVGIAVFFGFLMFSFSPFTYEIRRILAIVAFAPISTLAPVYTRECGGSASQSSFAISISIVAGLICMSILAVIL